MRAIYGRQASTRSVLRGNVAEPASANAFLDSIRGAKAQAIAEAGR